MSTSLELTPEESVFFEELRVFRAKKHVHVTLRVAGGWVRDKLLGRQSCDIDIALDTMTGVEFTSQFAQWCEAANLKPLEGFGIIRRNPDRSKYLEIATFQRYGLNVDVVTLRSATYAKPGSPVGIGTPYDDAMGRDFTCNALFYNLSTKTVEDFTKKGVLDLKERRLRTPRRSEETFSDDPLRAIRAIRFLSTLQFQLDPEILVACKNPRVLLALKEKVSVERCRDEIRKILMQGCVEDGLKALFELTPIGDVIFCSAEDVQKLHRSILPPPRFRLHPITLLFSLLRRPQQNATAVLKKGCSGVRASDFRITKISSEVSDEEFFGLVVLATLFYHRVPEPERAKPLEQAKTIEFFTTECLKFNRSKARLLHELARGAYLISFACHAVPSGASVDEFARSLNVRDPELLRMTRHPSMLEQKLAWTVSDVGVLWPWAVLIAKAVSPHLEEQVELMSTLEQNRRKSQR